MPWDRKAQQTKAAWKVARDLLVVRIQDLAALQAAWKLNPLTQGIGLRPQPWALLCRPVGPGLLGSLNTDQVNSYDDLWGVWTNGASGLNPSIPIRSIPTRHEPEWDPRGSACGLNPSIPIRSIPTFRELPERRARSRSLNPSIPIRSIPTQTLCNISLQETSTVSIPQYRSGQFLRGTSTCRRRPGGICLNPSIPIRSIPTHSHRFSPPPLNVLAGLNPSIPIRSIPTCTGGSTWANSTTWVSIPQYRSGQFQLEFLFKDSEAKKVSIPQYRSGQFQPAVYGVVEHLPLR